MHPLSSPPAQFESLDLARLRQAIDRLDFARIRMVAHDPPRGILELNKSGRPLWFEKPLNDDRLRAGPRHCRERPLELIRAVDQNWHESKTRFRDRRA
jgi:hypothetical protein